MKSDLISVFYRDTFQAKFTFVDYAHLLRLFLGVLIWREKEINGKKFPPFILWFGVLMKRKEIKFYPLTSLLPPFFFFFKTGNGENRIFFNNYFISNFTLSLLFPSFLYFFSPLQANIEESNFHFFFKPPSNWIEIYSLLSKPSIRFSLFKSSQAKPSST